MYCKLVGKFVVHVLGLCDGCIVEVVVGSDVVGFRVGMFVGLLVGIFVGLFDG